MISRISGVVVAIVGAVNAVSWMFTQSEAIGFEGTVTMKFATAVMFTWCGMYRGAPSEAIRKGLVKVNLLVIIASLLMAMTVHKPAEELYTVAGLPSLATLLCFVLVPMGRLAARGIVAIAVTALIGHAASVPWLFFHVPGVSTGMAIMTAVLFIALGVEGITSK